MLPHEREGRAFELRRRWLVPPSVQSAASFMDTMAVPAEPVKPVSQALLSSQGATYSEEWASPLGTMYAPGRATPSGRVIPNLHGGFSGEKESQSFPV